MNDLSFSNDEMTRQFDAMFDGMAEAARVLSWFVVALGVIAAVMLAGLIYEAVRKPSKKEGE